MLTFLVFCILLVVAWPIFALLAVAGFWIIVGLVIVLVTLWVLFYAIDLLEQAPEMLPVIEVVSMDSALVGGIIAWASAVTIIVMVVFVPKIVGKK